MKFDFYLSEMSVSDKHGGGLTLQRILGNDLQGITNFIHVNRFARDLHVKGDLSGRSMDLLSIWESDLVRKVIGRSRASRMSKKLPMIKMHAGSAAKKIAAVFEDKQQITALICPQGANSIFTLEALKKLKPVKYITWVMDDHLVKYQNESWQYPDGVEPVFAKHLQEAAHIFVISPAMQAFYKERFGVNSTVLFGSSGTIDVSVTAAHKSSDTLKIGYFGAVAAWQKDALKAVANALNGADAVLDIYSGIDRLPAELQADGVYFKGSVAPDKVLAQMQNYDAVLLPISFQQKIRNMSQFNIATKMSEYLACGIPVLAVGPPYAAMIRYLNDHQAAVTVASDNENDIREGFKQLRNAQHTGELLKNAQKLVVDEVGTQPMRKVWQAVGEAW
jgi:glycosyltransferase involved in cell wall biosynthesis